MALSFPSSPQPGDTYLSYIFDGVKWGVQAGVGGVAGVASFNTRVGAVVLALGDVTSATGSGSTAQASLGLATVAASGAYADLSGAPSLASYAPLAAPVFTGDARAVTPAAGDNDTSIATTAFVAAAVAPVANNVGRNLLHNPLFNVAQRGAGPFTLANAATLDRWFTSFSLDTMSVTQVAFSDAARAQVGDEAATLALANTFTGNAGAAAFNRIVQRIEDVRRLAGKAVTVSFWAAAGAGTPKLGVNINQLFGTGGSPSAGVNVAGQTVTLSTTYTRYSLTFAVPSVAGKTIGTNNDHSTELSIWFSSGTTQAASAGNPGVQSGTVVLWGVQLEIGSVATPLEKPDPQQDLAKCQRFYQVGSVDYMGYTGAGIGQHQSWAFPVPMRATPTCTNIVTNTTNISGASFPANDASIMRAVGSGVAAGGFIIIGTFTASADL